MDTAQVRRRMMDTTISVHADELRPGDVLEYGGQAHRIVDVVRNPGWSWPIALDGTGWAIALTSRLVSIARG
jgi:hypothetical protein